MLTPSGSQAVISCSIAELREHERGDGRGRAVGAIDEHAQRGHLDRSCRRRRRPSSRSAPQRPRAGATRRPRRPVGPRALGAHQRLDAVLVVVGELEAVRAEELDAVVRERVVRGRDDGAEARALLAHEPGHAGRRQHAGAQRDAAGGRDAGAQRVLEHRAGAARVTADDDGRLRRAALAREQRRGAPERERDLGAEHVAVGDAAHAVRPEQPTSHMGGQRFENCGRRRAPLRPAFLRSTARASRVR